MMSTRLRANRKRDYRAMHEGDAPPRATMRKVPVGSTKSQNKKTSVVHQDEETAQPLTDPLLRPVLGSHDNVLTKLEPPDLHTTLRAQKPRQKEPPQKEVASKKPTKPKPARKGDENSRSGPHRYRRHAKPPYAYAGLMVSAIWMTPEKCLTLSELHAKMEEMFPFFKGSYKGWRGSVRHLLSQHSCFVKCPRNTTGGSAKSAHWRVDASMVNLTWLQRQDTAVAKAMPFADTLMEELEVDFEELEGRWPMTKPSFHRHITLPSDMVAAAKAEHVNGTKIMDEIIQSDAVSNANVNALKNTASRTRSKSVRSRRSKKALQESPVKKNNVTQVVPSVLESESAVFCVDSNKAKNASKLSANALNFPHIISLLNSSPAVMLDSASDTEPTSPVLNGNELKRSMLCTLDSNSATVGVSGSSLLCEDSTEAALLSNIPTLKDENSKLLSFNELSWLINTNSNDGESIKDSLSNIVPGSECSRDSIFGENMNTITGSLSQISKQNKTNMSSQSSDLLFRSPPPVTRVTGSYGGLLPMSVKLEDPHGDSVENCIRSNVSSILEPAQQFADSELQTLIGIQKQAEAGSGLKSKFQNIAALLAPKIDKNISDKIPASSYDSIPSVPTELTGTEASKSQLIFTKFVPNVYLQKGSPPTDGEALDLVLKDLDDSKMFSPTDSIIQLPEAEQNRYSASQLDDVLKFNTKVTGVRKNQHSPDANSSSMDSPLTGADVLMTSGIRVDNRGDPWSGDRLQIVTDTPEHCDTTSTMSHHVTVSMDNRTTDHDSKLSSLETAAVLGTGRQNCPVDHQRSESLSVTDTGHQIHAAVMQMAPHTESMALNSAISRQMTFQGVISDMLLPEYLPNNSTGPTKCNSSEWPTNESDDASDVFVTAKTENRSVQALDASINSIPGQLSHLAVTDSTVRPYYMPPLQRRSKPAPASVPCQAVFVPPGLPPVKLLPSGAFQANPPVVKATQGAIDPQNTLPAPLYAVPTVNSTQYIYFQNPDNPATLIAVPVSLSGTTL